MHAYYGRLTYVSCCGVYITDTLVLRKSDSTNDPGLLYLAKRIYDASI
jgi:hypothetical protein